MCNIALLSIFLYLRADEKTAVVTVLSAVVAIAGIAIFLTWRHENKRTVEFEQAASDLGLPFFPTGDDSLRMRLKHFAIFSRGRSKKIRNMMYGEANGIELAIFDYLFVTGRGKGKRTHKQGVIYFNSPSLNLPHFAMRPEGLIQKIGSVFGYQDIDFDTHPDFSKSYLLQGENESAIRELFSDKILTFFETQRKICVEGNAKQFLFYRQGKRIKPNEVKQFMEEGFRIFALFRSSE